MQTQESLSIAMLEALASSMEEGEQERRSKLLRLTTAYARIIAAQGAGAFKAMPLEYADEDGHYDNSYPPEQAYKDFRGPRAITIVDNETESAATEGGFYHNYRTVTVDGGLFVGRDGTLYACDESGSGHFGQFAARPGPCRVMLTIAWRRLAAIDVPTERLELAERKLRELAFPHIAAAKALLASN